MHDTSLLLKVLFLLVAAIIVVSAFRRLGLGAIMGYLVAGILIGPSGLKLIPDPDQTHDLAELGVVFLLFTVGLELPFHRIKLMRGPVFLLGGAQVLLTTAIFALVAWLFGLSPAAATLVGAALAFSSTAIVLRMLSDQGELTTQYGRSAFAVLLVQDLAVGPFLVLAIALGDDDFSVATALVVAILKLVASAMLILGIGRIVLRHIFAQVAQAKEREVFVALTLFVVLGAGLLTHSAELSMAFGAFLAGMLLAETQYRHQVAADIQPFRGLLLGLFFMTVGMSIDLAAAAQHWQQLLALVASLLIAKAVILTLLARLFGQNDADAVHIGVLLSQAGEFGFVLLGAGISTGLLAGSQFQILGLAIALTMLLTPVLALLARRLSQKLERQKATPLEEAMSDHETMSDHVIIIGFGRVGHAVAKSLKDTDQAFIAVDLDPHRVTQAVKENMPVFYGDATRPEILSTLGVESARAVVVAVDNPKAAVQVVAFIRYIFPDLKVYARAKNAEHGRELEEAGAYVVVPELVATGLQLAGELMGSKALQR